VKFLRRGHGKSTAKKKIGKWKMNARVGGGFMMIGVDIRPLPRTCWWTWLAVLKFSRLQSLKSRDIFAFRRMPPVVAILLMSFDAALWTKDSKDSKDQGPRTMDQDKVGSDNGKIWKEGESLHFLPRQTACCVCCQFERWRGKISSSNLFQGSPPRKPLFFIATPWPSFLFPETY